MLWVIVWTQRLLSDRRGITAIEYAVLAGGIAIAIAAVCSGAGAFNSIQAKLRLILDHIPVRT